MIRWAGLAPWEVEFYFPGSLTSTFLATSDLQGLTSGVVMGDGKGLRAGCQGLGVTVSAWGLGGLWLVFKSAADSRQGRKHVCTGVPRS